MAQAHSSGAVQTVTHWGRYLVARDAAGRPRVSAHPADPNPSPMAAGYRTAWNHRARIAGPMIRRGWLEDGPRLGGNARGDEAFVPVDWDRALDLVAGEIARQRDVHGNQAIYAGSYGWASAGRFHHAQSQLHRFLNMAGGYARSVNAYSYAAAEVILPRVIAPLKQVTAEATTWPVIAEETELTVAFGGWPVKNAQVNAGGIGRHTGPDWMKRAGVRGMRMVLISPLKDDAIDALGAEWLPIRPNTDTALMLALCHALIAEGLADRAFLDRYTVGFEAFAAYVTGRADGIPKTPEWAARITGLAAPRIGRLAREMAGARTLVSLSWSLQRAEHGEQPYWAGVALAALLGGIGRGGEGIAFGLSAMHGVGNPNSAQGFAALPQGVNPVRAFIPVARITEMLEDPGGAFTYDGATHAYPDIRMIYWAGGNPFHHHQDLNRLKRAWGRPETVVAHEAFWNPLARHADIVLPATLPIERNDIAASGLDGYVMAMHRAVDPWGQARDDHAILAGLAERLGFAARFTEGRDEMGWLRHLYDISRQRAAARGLEWPGFGAFWEDGAIAPASESDRRVLLSAFRADPDGHPLKTPSGRIELCSETVAALDLPDCPGHPAWLEPVEWLGAPLARRYPLHLLSGQPVARLHSQLDCGGHSQDAKVAGREPARLHPADAAARGIAAGDVVRLFNDRGACLAGAVLDAGVMAGTVQLATGAWWDPDGGGLDRHGNPNVLTRDVGTSGLAQGPSAHSCLIEVERFRGDAPPVGAFEPPAIVGTAPNPE